MHHRGIHYQSLWLNKHYQSLWLNCCIASSFKDTEAIICDNACRGLYGTSAWPHSMHEPSIHPGYPCVMWLSQQPERRPLAQPGYDTFVTLAYYREYEQESPGYYMVQFDISDWLKSKRLPVSRQISRGVWKSTQHPCNIHTDVVHGQKVNQQYWNGWYSTVNLNNTIRYTSVRCVYFPKEAKYSGLT